MTFASKVFCQNFITKILGLINCFLKDEKIQHFLGHFQKDFEGGVSAENLGKWNNKSRSLY